jgi:hypothetical protein
MNEQGKIQKSRMIRWSMKQAMCICPEAKEIVAEERDWVTDFIENPYFSRPKLLPSGKAPPETIAYWKAEDDLKNPRKPNSWRTPKEGRDISFIGCFQ